MKKFVYILTAASLLLLAFQIIKTQLVVTVVNELGNKEAGATVQLFETEEDYKKETNVAAEAVTDAKGIARFKDLKAISYYIIVRKEDRDNAGGGEKTSKLEGGRINKITVVIQ
ncbi:MAG: carboxypeptidase-like regulatory domain-containing protein [Cyclobacteriaceae bacterium]|nr:carboxypeptidase-like regulatory domain-containing protein [Cyclobacteriaceae bacterium]MCX7637886.1 carboxypeptidase-like regulatory domain-containing protein [Cyclobacteriaceae bacterium]MDW8330484.1 carboxypeptidase-like regulatory domain-containing protein [Cyclobacteriaceae bacterium]